MSNTKKLQVEYFTCACGKKHAINGQDITCSDAGHYIFITAGYWSYNKDQKKKSSNIAQQTLF